MTRSFFRSSLSAGEDFHQADLPQLINSLVGRHLQKTVALFVDNLGGKVDHVSAQVAFGGHFGGAAEPLLVAGVERVAEVVHLAAGVVEIVLSGDVVAAGGHDIGERAAQDGAAPVPDVERPGRVDADELDLHALAGAEVDVAEVAAVCQDGVHLAGQPLVFQGEIDEARRGDVDALDLFRGLDEANDLPGDGERAGADGPRQLERDARSVVAVLGVLGPLDDDIGEGDIGQLAGLLRGHDRPGQYLADFLLEFQRPSPVERG